MMTADRISAIVENFCKPSATMTIKPLGNGLINDTFLITNKDTCFVLQRINAQVFKNPLLIIDNLQRLNRHLADKQDASLRLQIPMLLSTIDGNNHCQDEQGSYWRAQQWIADSESREDLNTNREAEQIGLALGHFHRLCSDLPCHDLHDTLPGFHITPNYFQNYLDIANQIPNHAKFDSLLKQCTAIIAKFETELVVLEEAKQHGYLHERVIHGDPKLNNFLFRQNTDEIISLIDLDTVKPGLVHYDIGDCVRSCCHLPNNAFDLERCRLILSGYLREAGAFFNDPDYEYLYSAIWLLPLELGIRFLTDFLAGNPYFKISYSEQNLHRAVAQLQLCCHIYQQRHVLERMLQKLR